MKPSNKKSVTIIIPVYNGALLIKRCLDSVFNQKGDYDLEVIVIDDGSTDGSVDIVKKYPQAINLLSQSNQGPSAARNRGIEAASGKYLAFLDADDYWLSGFLHETVAFLEEHVEVIAVSVGQTHKIPGKPDIIAPAILKSEPGKFTEPIILSDFCSFWAKHNHVCTGSVLMRSIFAKLTGGQRTDLRITEDLEFWAYLATYGKWGFIPEVLFVSDGGLVTKQKGWIEKNRLRWVSAPTIEEWESRIIQRLNKPLTTGYLYSKGRIAGNLAYSMIMSKRDKQALVTIKTHREYLKRNRLNRLLILASINYVLWKCVCHLLRAREYNR